MRIEFKRLNEVDPAEIIELMNNRRVRRYMPLSPIDFGLADCEAFVAEKGRMWVEHGFGPWAIVADGRFAGWGGLQPENGEVDLALVLHPSCWGVGKCIYERFIAQAFGEMGHRSVTVLLPPARTRIRGLLRLGFEEDGTLTIEDHLFIRYRLRADRYYGSSGGATQWPL